MVLHHFFNWMTLKHIHGGVNGALSQVFEHRTSNFQHRTSKMDSRRSANLWIGTMPCSTLGVLIFFHAIALSGWLGQSRY